MASEDINNLTDRFDSTSIESPEDIRQVVNAAQIDPTVCLQRNGYTVIGNIITPNTFSRGFAEKQARLIWKNKVGNFELRRKSKNLFTFTFESKEDWKWVLSEAPWCLDGFLWILNPWNPTHNHRDLVFDKQQFWVTFKDFPEEFLNVYVANEIGAVLGEVKELDSEDAKPIDSNDVSALIEIKINKSLIRGVLSQNAANCTQWIPFFYQKQPHQLCPACFILDHDDDDCKNKAKEVRDLSQQLFGFLDKIPYNMTSNDYWNIEDAPTRISPKKSSKAKKANIVLFVRPEDCHYCNSV
ncbi:uncharacterized protein LOC113311068 [Papaver somniferum]|uniref:uncharacterized protein LOC113311068 n=1 Tax=Papaver somniferum TaxID=3469 RepID=UPI000E6F9829|nr:uncharacterized protein LOC113311068 [Papaver somniferum]